MTADAAEDGQPESDADRQLVGQPGGAESLLAAGAFLEQAVLASPVPA
jgi:hypothetical protein